MELWIFDRKPKIIPPGWGMHEVREDGWHWVQMLTGLSVILSGEKEADERRWMHASVAAPTRLPTWDELRAVKEWTLGTEAKAIQVIPPRSQYVNLHPYCLHLFACIDGDGLPDFTHGSGSL